MTLANSPPNYSQYSTVSVLDFCAIQKNIGHEYTFDSILIMTENAIKDGDQQFDNYSNQWKITHHEYCFILSEDFKKLITIYTRATTSIS